MSSETQPLRPVSRVLRLAMLAPLAVAAEGVGLLGAHSLHLMGGAIVAVPFSWGWPAVHLVSPPIGLPTLGARWRQTGAEPPAPPQPPSWVALPMTTGDSLLTLGGLLLYTLPGAGGLSALLGAPGESAAVRPAQTGWRRGRAGKVVHHQLMRSRDRSHVHLVARQIRSHDTVAEHQDGCAKTV